MLYFVVKATVRAAQAANPVIGRRPLRNTARRHGHPVLFVTAPRVKSKVKAGKQEYTHEDSSCDLLGTRRP